MEDKFGENPLGMGGFDGGKYAVAKPKPRFIIENVVDGYKNAPLVCTREMFSFVRIRFKVAVPAAYIGGLENAAAEEVLDAKILSFDERLKGILLAYDELEGENVGMFQDEQPDVLYSFSSLVTIFSPREGLCFPATVSEISSASVFLLAAGVFPIVVPASGFPLNTVYAKLHGGKKALVSSASIDKIRVEVGKEYTLKCVKVSATGSRLDTINVEATFQI